METLKMKRRDLLRISALAGVAVVTAACAPTATPTAAPTVASNATAAATEVPKATTAATTAPTAVPKATEAPKTGFQGEIEFYAQSYTPTSESPNPDPKAPKREAMKTLSTQWMELHPGINFKFMQAPTGDFTAWINTQLIGGTGPDMFNIWLPTLNEFADKGMAVSLNDYLELPNKYIPEDKTAWKTTFKSPFLTTFSPKGQWGGVPMDKVGIGVYCNVDMFKSVGIDLEKELVPELGMPKDWATMISWCKKLKEAGNFAFGMEGEFLVDSWWQFTLCDMLYWNLIPQFDVLNYHQNIEMRFQEGYVNQEEAVMQYCCNGWKAFSDPATRALFEIVKDLTQYMPDGFASPEFLGGGPYELFATNRLAMYWSGTWMIGAIMQDDRRKFEFSSFQIPPLTQATTPLASDPPILPCLGSSYGGVSYGLNHKCIAKGNVDECVDWLMYITTPKNDEMIVNEVPMMIPAQNKATTLPEIAGMSKGNLKELHPWDALPLFLFSGFNSSSRYTDTFKRENTLYYLGEQDLDTFMEHVDTAAQESQPELIRAAAIQYSTDGSWDLTQWKCQPKV